MYWRTLKTATLTSIQHTVHAGLEAGQGFAHLEKVYGGLSMDVGWYGGFDNRKFEQIRYFVINFFWK